ncbi:PREDICTED: CD63 antigen-like [Polistes dominula]|uniref:Tetraspanin n=1 Tax=Polistes dominula TaxID=743375 RepID=A0ABM1IB74_POLDO|nr:PREDICTED: CD63 antigen-like [Polistes dominula]
MFASSGNIIDTMASMKLSASSKCVKYLMFIFNLAFVMTGIIFLIFGTAIHAVYYNYNHILDNKYLSVPSLMIAIGIIIFFIAFFGCCGAVRENYCMLITFTALLIFIFILELSAGIAGYVLRSDAGEILENKMKATIPTYKNSTEITQFWDEMQQDFKCCGVINSTDWKAKFPDGELPMSCCSNKIGQIGSSACNITVDTVYKQGCEYTFGQYIKAHAVQLGGVGLGIAIVQAVGIWFSIYLARSIRNSYESV